MKKDGKKKQFHKKNKNGKAYIVGDWFINIESLSGSSSDDSDEEEKVIDLVMGTNIPPLPPSAPSSTHLWLMTKGDRKVQNDDQSNGNDSDNEYEFTTNTYDKLVDLVKD